MLMPLPSGYGTGIIWLFSAMLTICQYAEKIYDVVLDSTGKFTEEVKDEGDEDIEAAIKKEVSHMNSNQPSTRLIAPVYLDLQCVLFFKTTTPIVPVKFVQLLCEDAMRNPASRTTRFANRLTPMSLMGKATESDIMEVGKSVLGEHFQLDESVGHEWRDAKKPEANGRGCSVSSKMAFLGISGISGHTIEIFVQGLDLSVTKIVALLH
jgi:hypothetical protein